MSQQSQDDVYAPVNAKNAAYDERRIVDEDGKDPINDTAEDAMAAIKGHIERQDLEGTGVQLEANEASPASASMSQVSAKENDKLDNSRVETNQKG